MDPRRRRDGLRRKCQPRPGPVAGVLHRPRGAEAGADRPVIRYAESNQCRMSTLVRHFGDLADGQTACGICDFCAPAQCVAQRFRTATEAERTALFRVIAALRAGDAKSTGKLHGELCPNGEMSRDVFEEVLGAMARAGLVRLSDAVFEKDGKQIPYRSESHARGSLGRRTDSHRFHHKRSGAGLGHRQEQEESRHARETEAFGATGKGSRGKSPCHRPNTLDRIPVSKRPCVSGEWPRPDDAEFRRFASSVTGH